ADRGVYRGHGFCWFCFCRCGGMAGRGTRVSSDAAGVIEETLRSLELGFEQPRPGAFLVKLEGQHKLATMTWLVVGEHSLGVEAFFCRQPDENHEAFYRFLLERNG